MAAVLKLSRRSLLSGVSVSALTGVLDLHAAPQHIESQKSPGRICLGLNGLNYYNYFYAFINIWKQGARIAVIAEGTTYTAEMAPGIANSAWGRFLDEDGELVRPLPREVTQVSRVFYGTTADGQPDGFDRSGQRWVLKWDGTARDVAIAGVRSQQKSVNRIDWVWDSNLRNMWVTFSKIDHADPPRNIRMLEARHEVLLDAGKVFNPEWLDKVREGSGIVRFMTWQSTNSDRSTLRVSDIPKAAYCSYGGSSGMPGIKGGVPLDILTALSNQVRSHPWVCIPAVLGTPKLSSIQAATAGENIIIQSPGHDWSVGDEAIPYGTNWPQVEKKVCRVVQANRREGTLVLDAGDTRDLPPYKSSHGALTAKFDLASISREVGLLATHFRDRLSPGLVTYFEFSNETWNWMFDAPHWLLAQAKAKFGHESAPRMAGYLAAHCMRTVRETYSLANRQKWKGVLAVQTGNAWLTNDILNGVNQYLKENDPALKLTDIMDYLAVAGYFSGALGERNKVVLEWMAQSDARWKQGAEPTRYSYFNRIMNEDCLDGRHGGGKWSTKGNLEFWRAQKKVADANGLGFIQYEGGNHNDPKFFGQLSAPEQADLMQFYKNSNHTPEDAGNYTRIFQDFVDMGGVYPSKFVEMGPVSRYGSWGGLRYIGDKNAVWDAVVAFNGRS